MVRSEVAPLSLQLGDHRRKARRARSGGLCICVRALLGAFAMSFAPARKPPSFLPRRLAAASAALMRSEIKLAPYVLGRIVIDCNARTGVLFSSELRTRLPDF
jgi:hypothetical protein